MRQSLCGASNEATRAILVEAQSNEAGRALAAGVSYFGRAEIAEVWKGLRDSVEGYFRDAIEKPAHEVGESTKKKLPGMKDA